MCCGVTSALTYFLPATLALPASHKLLFNLLAYHFPTRFHVRSDMLKEHFTSLKYQVFRSEAFKTAQMLASKNATLKALNIDTNSIRFGPIDTVALDASCLWGNAYASYPWGDVQVWKQRDLRGLDLALWFASELCGMCYATPRKSQLRIKVILLEDNPSTDHPLKGLVAPLMLTAVRAYAVTLGCTQIEIENPDQGAIPWYTALGFIFDTNKRLVIPVKHY